MAKPNKENIITAILEQLNTGTTFTECFEVILSNFKLSEPTFSTYWKDANSRYLQTQQEAQKAMNDTTVSESAKAAKNGLKSKLQLVAEVQKMLDDNIYVETFWNFSTKRPESYTRALTPLERKALYERISKFEGMDAPTKIANTDTEGKDKEIVVKVIMDDND